MWCTHTLVLQQNNNRSAISRDCTVPLSEGACVHQRPLGVWHCQGGLSFRRGFALGIWRWTDPCRVRPHLEESNSFKLRDTLKQVSLARQGTQSLHTTRCWTREEKSDTFNNCPSDFANQCFSLYTTYCSQWKSPNTMSWLQSNLYNIWTLTFDIIDFTLPVRGL